MMAKRPSVEPPFEMAPNRQGLPQLTLLGPRLLLEKGCWESLSGYVLGTQTRETLVLVQEHRHFGRVWAMLNYASANKQWKDTVCHYISRLLYDDRWLCVAEQLLCFGHLCHAST